MIKQTSFLVLLLVPALSLSQVSVSHSNGGKRWFYGGGVGFGVGNNVTYFEFMPLVGVHLSPRLSAGTQFIFQHRRDTTFEKTLTTDDYGTTVFGRYRLNRQLFLQAQYEYLDYGYYRVLPGDIFEENRADFSTFMAGGGFVQPLGGRASFYATALYNFNHDDPDNPYTDPVIIRFGIGVGF